VNLLERAQQRFGSSGVEIVALSIDQLDAPDQLRVVELVDRDLAGRDDDAEPALRMRQDQLQQLRDVAVQLVGLSDQGLEVVEQHDDVAAPEVVQHRIEAAPERPGLVAQHRVAQAARRIVELVEAGEHGGNAE
jgi:AmiR/NasT family two-component response regulator